MQKVEEAYSHVHDLEWLQGCDLADLLVVHERAQPYHTMPEAQALRGLLTEAALQVIADIRQVPNMASVQVFLERHLQGARVSDIAKELGVTREWCSRSYRKDAIRLAAMQTIRLASRERNP